MRLFSVVGFVFFFNVVKICFILLVIGWMLFLVFISCVMGSGFCLGIKLLLFGLRIIVFLGIVFFVLMIVIFLFLLIMSS